MISLKHHPEFEDDYSELEGDCKLEAAVGLDIPMIFSETQVHCLAMATKNLWETKRPYD